MKVTFLGGGSLRLLPILRGIMGEIPDVFRGGEIRLLDRQQERAEAVARLIEACPEYQNVSCKITCPEEIDAALEGIDVLYLTMAARREPSETLAAFAAQEHGYYSSDQLSVNGAFLSLRLGNTILEIARKMEKLCPQALMLIFPNPVSVYSCMVNTYTKIKALGICGGFNNHRWDLSRLCGRNEFDPDWNVVAAGVNHLSFILRGEYKGEDLYASLLPRILGQSWKCMELPGSGNGGKALETALKTLYRLYRRYRTVIFSTELDGLAHIACSEVMEFQRERLAALPFYDPEREKVKSELAEQKRFDDFIRQSKSPEQINWNIPWPENLYFGKDLTDISIPIFRAVAGIGKIRIVASCPNRGAVAGLSDNAALEYTMDLFKDSIIPVENQFIPYPFQGLTASLSEFQTLQAEAIAKHDPEIFASALDAYPIHRFQPGHKEFFRKMFDIYTDLDPHMLEARRYFEK